MTAKWRVRASLAWGFVVIGLFVATAHADVGSLPWQFVAVGTVLTMAFTALE